MRVRYLSGLLLSACLTAGVPTAAAAPPSELEQLWLETINRFRAAPSAELDILANYTTPGTGTSFGTPRSSDPNVAFALQLFNVSAADLRTQFNALTPAAPLAWSSNLHAAALGHSNAMIAADTQSHQLPGEDPLATRLTNAGYAFTNAAENVFASTQSVFHGHAAFVLDWGAEEDGAVNGIQNPPGHRNALLSDTYREIGIAAVAESDPATDVGPLVVTQNLGRRAGDPFLTGVAFTDLIATDAFYTIGEGLGAMTVNVFDAARSGILATTSTFASGGYSIQLTPGTYDVQFLGSGFDFFVDDFAFTSGGNQKLDFVAAAIPEPAQVVLLALGLGVVLLRRALIGRRETPRG